MSSGATGLAIAAFVISLVTLLWNLGRAWIESPRVSVEIARKIKLDANGTARHSVIRVTVVNHGSDAITVRDVGLRAAKVPEGPFSFENYQTSDKAADVSGDYLPVRMEGRDCKHWEFTDLEKVSVGCVSGYCELYRSHKLRQSNPFKTIRSRTGVNTPASRDFDS